MGKNLLKDIVMRAPFGFAHHKIVTDSQGSAVDYVFLEVNAAFEKQTGLNAGDIIGRPVSEVMPDILHDPFDWIGWYGRIALNGGDNQFEQYSKGLQRWYQVHAYSSEKYYFSTVFFDITSQKEKYVELNRFFSVNLDLLCIADVDGNFIQINEEWSRLLGYTVKELTHKKFLDFVHPDDISATLAAMTTLEGQEQILNFTNRYRCKDGSYRFIEWRSHPYGRLIYAAARDITERRLMEEKLRQSKDNFKTFFDTIDDLIFISDQDGALFFVNTALRAKLGYSPLDIRGMHILDLHPRDRHREAEHFCRQILEGTRTTCPLPLARKDGTLLPVDTRIWSGKWDGKNCIFGISKDLSLEQEALQKFNKLFENNPALMAVSVMPSRVFTEVNHAFLIKTGYQREDVIGKTAAQMNLFVNPNDEKEVLKELLQQGSVHNRVLKIRTRAHNILDGLFSGEIIESQGKQYVLMVIVDITEQAALTRKVETQRQRLENIIDGTRLGTWEWNIQTGEALFNDRWADMAGYTLQELAPVSIQTWTDLAHPEDLKKSEIILQEHFNDTADYYQCESRMKHKNGTWIWVMDRGKVIEWDEKGKPLKMFGTHTDITAQKTNELMIQELAIRDPLTGVYNSRYIFDRATELLAEFSRNRAAFSMAIVDIDHFKVVNDTYGHLAGDYALKEFTSIIAQNLRPYDLLGRYGGEEFIIVSPHTGKKHARIIFERILASVGNRVFTYEHSDMQFTFSAGIADSTEIDPDNATISTMIGIADKRLYLAKNNGRNQIVIDDNIHPMQDE